MRKKNKSEQNSNPEAGGVGSVLAAARNAKGIPIEKAAHDTRISATRLREIEGNDFSKLSHPTYARMFIADYARYLGVPVESIREKLPESGAFGGEGYQYLQSLPPRTTGRPGRTAVVRAPRSASPALFALAGLALVVLLVIGGFSVWVTVRNIKRLTTHSPKQHPAVQVVDTAAPTTASASGSPAPTAVQDLAALHKEDAALLTSPAPDAASPAPEATASPTAAAAASPAATAPSTDSLQAQGAKSPSDSTLVSAAPQPSPAAHQ